MIDIFHKIKKLTYHTELLKLKDILYSLLDFSGEVSTRVDSLEVLVDGIGNGGGTTTIVSSDLPKLHSTAKKLKFVMYWARLSPNMDWWKELDNGMITWDNISSDLDQIKAELGVNAVRIFTYYDHQFRQTGTLGWTDGAGNHLSLIHI